MATKSSRVGQHSRTSSTIVPAVPKIFDRPATASSRAPARGAAQQESASREGNGNGSGSDNSNVPKTGLSLQPVGNAGSALGQAALTPKPPATATDVARSPNARPRVSLPKHAHYHAPAGQAPAQVSMPVQDASPRDAKADTNNTSAPPARARHNRSMHRIAFGSFGNLSESSESSPTMPPSATSTHYTQPTPVSDARSQASRSETEQLPVDQTSEKMALPNPDAAQNVRLVGPYRPGLIGSHAVEFFKHQQQFLMHYMQQLYGRNDGDVTLEICFGNDSVTYNLHSAILSQSAMLSKAIQQARELRRFSAPGRILVTIQVLDRFVNVRAVEHVLKSMYGLPSFNLETVNRPFLDPYLFYAHFAAGCLLGFSGAQVLGVKCILDIINWQTLPDVFDLCLTGREFAATFEPYPMRTDEITSRLFQPNAMPIFDKALAVLDYEMKQPDFSFDANAPNLALLGGLPPLESSVKLSNSPSAGRPGIVFGDQAVGGPEKNSTLSSLLLSLPLPVLQRILADTKTGPAPSAVKAAVHERERRRAAWSATPSFAGLVGMKEICVPTEGWPSGIGIINDMT